MSNCKVGEWALYIGSPRFRHEAHETVVRIIAPVPTGPTDWDKGWVIDPPIRWRDPTAFVGHCADSLLRPLRGAEGDESFGLAGKPVETVRPVEEVAR